MKEIVVISGKGGTGKTILTASFAALTEKKVVCDCDVDAADLHLLLHPEVRKTTQFVGGKKANIDHNLCSGCLECVTVCRFDAVRTRSENHGGESSVHVSIDHVSCEGCTVCAYVCPADAITVVDNVSGEWYISETGYGPMVHAKLGIAEENSGKLVSVTRAEAKRIADEEGLDYVIIDGPPGIGCPVIASITGVDLAVIVTEPTVSGIHDMERVQGVARHFKIDTACVINKFDINHENSERIEEWCRKMDIPVIGKIPFDNQITSSMVMGVPAVEYSNSSASQEIRKIWEVIQ
jgi:MinD superfamily P-loop ATPase